MHNFKDHLNLSQNIRDNAYLAYLNQQEMYKLLSEKKHFKKKKGKKEEEDEGEEADKDYDGDGKVESGKDEYFGSRDKAIKKAIAKKKALKEGRVISGDQFLYGGFPRILSEQEGGATNAFNDSGDVGQKNIATQSDAKEESLKDLQSQLASLQTAMEHLRDLREPGEYDPSRGTRGLKIRDEIVAIEDKIKKHPDYKKPAEQSGTSFFAKRTPDPNAFHDRWQIR